MRKKVKLSLIQNETSRKTTFNKRKKGLMKKINELVTLCDVKTCAVVNSPYNSPPEAWPSREGVEEVVSKFMEVSVKERSKKMVDQEAFIRQRIAKEKEHLHKLRDENHNSKIQEQMFGCLKGEMDLYHLDERDLRDLSSFIDKYLNDLTRRIEILNTNGESSSSLPTVVADAAAPIENQQKPVQFQYKALYDFYDQIPQKIRDFNMNTNMNSSQNMILDLNQRLDVGKDKDILCMDSSHQQREMDCLTTITNAVADLYAPKITNNI